MLIVLKRQSDGTKVYVMLSQIVAIEADVDAPDSFSIVLLQSGLNYPVIGSPDEIRNMIANQMAGV